MFRFSQTPNVHRNIYSMVSLRTYERDHNCYSSPCVVRCEEIQAIAAGLESVQSYYQDVAFPAITFAAAARGKHAGQNANFNFFANDCVFKQNAAVWCVRYIILI